MITIEILKIKNIQVKRGRIINLIPEDLDHNCGSYPDIFFSKLLTCMYIQIVKNFLKSS